MKNWSIGFFRLFVVFLFTSASYAYEITDEKTTVTPGCTGGVLYSKVESGFLSTPKDAYPNSETNTFKYNHEFQAELE